MARLVTLPNGFRLVLDHLPHVRTASMGVWCDVGSRHEAEALSGVSHFLEHMAFKGTSRHTVEQIANAFENLGSMINASTGFERTNYHLTCLGGDAVRALPLLAEIVTDSVFPETAMETERGVVVEEINMYADQPDSVAWELACASALPGQALGRPIVGTAETVRAITRGQMADYYKAMYRPDRMVFAISGNFDEAAVGAEACALFGRASGVSAARAEPFAFAPGERRDERAVNQVNIVAVLPTVGVSSTDRQAVEVMAAVLGGGMSSRLFREVREKQGLCYGIGAHPLLFSDGGLLAVASGTTPDLAGRLIAGACAEMARLADDAAEDETRRAAAVLKSRAARTLEGTMSRASHFATDVLAFGTLPDADADLARYDAVTAADVRRVAAETFAAAPALGLCGPVSGVPGAAEMARLLHG
jgi:predicted Zn-dependent peptidase